MLVLKLIQISKMSEIGLQKLQQTKTNVSSLYRQTSNISRT